MPLRPFPYQLGIGTDIIHVGRIRSILAKTNGSQQRLQSFLRRFLTPREQQEFFKRYGTTSNETAPQLDIVSKHLAGRWAAKEAVIKAVRWRRLAFHDIVIWQARNDSGLLAVILDRHAGNRGHAQPATDFHADMKHNITSFGSNEATGSSNMHRSGLIDDTMDSSDPIEKDSDHAHNEAVLHMPHALDSSSSHDGTVNEQQYDRPSGQIAKISISHDGEYATAVCLAAQEPMDGDVGGEAAARELL